MRVVINLSALVCVTFSSCRCLHTVSWQPDGEPKGEQRGRLLVVLHRCCVNLSLPARLLFTFKSGCCHMIVFSLLNRSSSSPPAGERPADLSAGHVQSEQGDPQRPRPGVTGRLQAHVTHRGPRHRFPDPAAHAGRWKAAVEGRPQPALQHQGMDERTGVYWGWSLSFCRCCSFCCAAVFCLLVPKVAAAKF